MNSVNGDELTSEIGARGFREISNILWRLTGQRDWTRTAYIARYAPSIIARGEAEMLGVSMPRFAFRVYLNEQRTSFVNVRRLGTLANQADKWGRRHYELSSDPRA